MNQLEFSLNEQCRDSLWPGENRVTFRLCLSAFLQTELPRNAVLMNPPSEYPFGSAIEEQFNYVLGLLERDGYRYLQDSGAIKPRFEQRRFEVLRRVTGPNNSPIYSLSTMPLSTMPLITWRLFMPSRQNNKPCKYPPRKPLLIGKRLLR